MKNDVVTPDITVVIPCYNAEHTIERCIESAINQNEVSVEVIVVNDGSTDRSIQKIKKYTQCVQVIDQLNCGACAARNNGLAKADADYIMFLDADDFLSPDCLGNALTVFRGIQADVGIIRCWLYDGFTIGPEMTRPRTEHAREFVIDWLYGFWIPPCSVLWKKHKVHDIGGWNEGLRKHQDAEVMLRAAAYGIRFAAVEAEQRFIVMMEVNLEYLMTVLLKVW